MNQDLFILEYRSSFRKTIYSLLTMSGRSIHGCILKYQYSNLSAGPLSCNRGSRESFSFWAYSYQETICKKIIKCFPCLLFNQQARTKVHPTVTYHRPDTVFLWKTCSYVSIIPPSHSQFQFLCKRLQSVPWGTTSRPSCSSKLWPSPKWRDERGFWTFAGSLWIMIEKKGLLMILQHAIQVE